MILGFSLARVILNTVRLTTEWVRLQFDQNFLDALRASQHVTHSLQTQELISNIQLTGLQA